VGAVARGIAGHTRAHAEGLGQARADGLEQRERQSGRETGEQAQRRAVLAARTLEFHVRATVLTAACVRRRSF
jgi:hypothetical protein